MAKEANISDAKVNFSSEVPLEELYPEETDERERLSGGPYQRDPYHGCLYQRRHVPIEDALSISITPDMEAMIDAHRVSAQAEELAQEECFPAPHDLLPFHAIMGSAVMGEDVTQPCFSSFLSEKTQVKITYHQGRRIVSPKKEVFT